MRPLHLIVSLAVTLAGCGEAFSQGPGGGGGGGNTSDTSASSSVGSTTGQGGSSSMSASSSSSGGGGHGDRGCEQASDCPRADTACGYRTCDGGVCGNHVEPAGTVLPEQVPHDCVTTVCDGGGGLQSEIDADDVPEDTPGDCLTWICAGSEPTPVPNNKDAPDDGLECTTEVCDEGTLVTGNAPTGTPCSAGLCDASASCVANIPVQCATNAGVFTGCDGQNHVEVISYIDSFGQDAVCHSSGDLGYCPTGNACQMTAAGGAAIDGTCL